MTWISGRPPTKMTIDNEVVLNDSFVSEANSTTTPLASGATFTGTWTDALKYPSVIVSTRTDQNGTWTVQFSPDGVNVDSTLTRYYHTDHIEVPHRFTMTRRYFRVTFTNTSASDQTYIRLQTILGPQEELNIPVDAVMAQDYDATSVRPTNFIYEVALGRRQGATTWNKWGYNADIDTASEETIWSPGGRITPLTTASTLTVVSSSANDDGDPAGTGARSIIVYGIDANRLSQTEVVTLNGTTNVVTSTTWLGINRIAIYLAGSLGVNDGTITATATTGGSTQAQIPAGQGSSQQAVFFTQANHQALADWLLINVNKIAGGTQPVVTIKAWVYSLVSGSRYEVFRHVIDTAVENSVELKPSQPFIIGEKSLLEFTATTDTNNTVASIRFSIIEFRDVDA